MKRSQTTIAVAGGLVLMAVALYLLERNRASRPVEPDAPDPASYTAGESAAPAPADATPAAPAVTFTEVTREAGIDFVHATGGDGRKLLPETMGGGCAFFDYDGDGDPDLVLASGRPWELAPGAETPSGIVLYRNDGAGSFTDVTDEAGLRVVIYAQGFSCADHDGDGDLDLFVTAVLDGNRLYRNDGGRFVDVTAASGLTSPTWTDDEGREHRQWSTSAAFLDYDGDGWLDLFVCNYVQWSPENDIEFTRTGIGKSFAQPQHYEGQSCLLYRNRGDGTFEDVTAKAGVHNPDGKSLGVAVADLDADGRPDLIVANDTQPNYLYRNRGDGTFEDIALEAGIAYDANGRARGAMGIDTGSFGKDGRPGILIGNFSGEATSLYESLPGDGSIFLVDAAPRTRLSGRTLLPVTFGAAFLDYDLDGWLDLVCANGHIEPEIGRVEKDVTYAQAPQLFRNLGGERFEDVGAAAGEDLARPMVGRGLCTADIDGDGDLDLLIAACGDRPRLLRNDGASPAHHWLRVRLQGASPNTHALGARVRIAAGGRGQERTVRTGSSYLSQSELTLTFGLGEATAVERLTVTWPDGTEQVVAVDAVDRVIAVTRD